MKKSITKLIQRVINNYGYEIKKIQNSLTIVKDGNWLDKLNIETIIDIGANEGQFITHINSTIPNKKIIAFEPIKHCYDKLLINTSNMNVLAFNCGLSDHEGVAEINISENYVSSSILPMENMTRDLYPDATYVTKQSISLKRLDDVIKEIPLKENVLIKMDVQGYEDIVIAGGEETIKKATVILIESSFQQLYEGQCLFEKLYDYFTSHGFKFVGFTEQVFSKTTGIPLYGDSIFIKADLVKAAF